MSTLALLRDLAGCRLVLADARAEGRPEAEVGALEVILQDAEDALWEDGAVPSPQRSARRVSGKPDVTRATWGRLLAAYEQIEYRPDPILAEASAAETTRERREELFAAWASREVRAWNARERRWRDWLAWQPGAALNRQFGVDFGYGVGDEVALAVVGRRAGATQAAGVSFLARRPGLLARVRALTDAASAVSDSAVLDYLRAAVYEVAASAQTAGRSVMDQDCEEAVVWRAAVWALEREECSGPDLDHARRSLARAMDRVSRPAPDPGAGSFAIPRSDFYRRVQVDQDDEARPARWRREVMGEYANVSGTPPALQRAISGIADSLAASQRRAENPADVFGDGRTWSRTLTGAAAAEPKTGD